MSEIDNILEEYESMSPVQRAGKALDNARYEIFSAYVASGHTPPNAYRIAFGLEPKSAVGVRPSRLLERDDVRHRIGALLHEQTQMVLARAVLVEKNILDEYAWGIREARMAGKFKDHKGYLDSVSKIFGLFTDTKTKSDAAEKSLEELREEAKLLQSEMGQAFAELPSGTIGDNRTSNSVSGLDVGDT